MWEWSVVLVLFGVAMVAILKDKGKL